MTSLPLSGFGEGMDHLKSFLSLDHDELRDKNDQRNETFPTNPKSRRLKFSGKKTQFSLNCKLTPCWGQTRSKSYETLQILF